MVIGHYKATLIAHAPEAICDVINKYTDHQSYVYGYGYPKKGLASNTTLMHLHNRNVYNFKKRLIQYHSEPFRVDLNTNITKLVIAQYHATLPEYKDCLIVRNPIDLSLPVYLPKYNSEKIRIGFAPSVLVPTSIWADKGYTETLQVLEEIKYIFKDLIEIDIITGVPLAECLYRKSLCNIFIDEVKTPSYHRSGLESLAMGQLTICSVSPEVEEVMLNSCGAKKLPFLNVYYPELKEALSKVIKLGLDHILNEGFIARHWMEQYWNPEIIANEYIKIYEQI